MERLDDGDWSGLPPDLRSTVKAWLEENRTFCLEPRAWFTDGRSGEPVGRVVRTPRHRRAEQLVLKFLTFEAGQRSNTVNLAWEESESFRAHLAKPLRSDLVFDRDRRGILMRVAGGDFTAFQPLTDQWEDKNFPEYCSQIARSVVQDWNGQGALRRRRDTIAGVLNDRISERLDRARQRAEKAGYQTENARIVFQDGESGVNPFMLLTGRYADREIQDLLIGNAHGDLSGRNILLRAHPRVDPDSYVLIDYDRYSPAAPLARDPMHLLVALTLDHIREFASASWPGIARAIVDPDSDDHPRRFEEFRKASIAIRDGSTPQSKMGFNTEWRLQCHLFLIQAGLLHVDRRIRDVDQNAAMDWCLRLASYAAEAFLKELKLDPECAKGTVSVPTVASWNDVGTTARSLIKDRVMERKRLLSRLQSGTQGIAVMRGARGVGKSKIVQTVLQELKREGVPSRIIRHDANAITKLDTETLISYLEMEAGPNTIFRAGLSSLVRLEGALQRLGGSQVVLVVDSAENLLDAESKRVSDPHLDRALEMLATQRGHAVTVLLVSQEMPKSSVLGMTWPTSEPPHPVYSLPWEPFFEYLSSLDQRGRLNPAFVSQESLGTLYGVMDGNPRLAELASVIVSGDSGFELPALADFLKEREDDDVFSLLMQLLLDGMSEVRRRLLRALAAFDTPVPVDSLAEALVDVERGRMENALDALVGNRIVYHENEHYYLPPSDRLAIMTSVPEADREELYYWASLGLAELKNATPRNVGELREHFAELKALLRAREYPSAHEVITSIDPLLREWNCSHLLLEQRLEVRGKVEDENGEIENLHALAEIYKSLGCLDEANKMLGQAWKRVAGQAGDVRAMKLRLTSASISWAHDIPVMPLGQYEYVRDEAEREDNPEVLAAALEGIAKIHHSHGKYTNAIKQANLALAQYDRLDYPDTPAAQSDAALRSITLALNLALWHGEIGEDSQAERYVGRARSIQNNYPDDRFHAACLDALADLRLDLGLLDEAESLANDAVEQALRRLDPVTLIQARTTLSFCYLRAGRRPLAWRETEMASHYRVRGQALVVLALSALAAHQQDDQPTAERRFRQLLAEASERTGRDSEDFAAHDLVGYAVCGLHLRSGHDLDKAVDEFHKARRITPQAPVLVARLRFLLTQLDATDDLIPVFDVL